MNMSSIACGFLAYEKKKQSSKFYECCEIIFSVIKVFRDIDFPWNRMAFYIEGQTIDFDDYSEISWSWSLSRFGMRKICQPVNQSVKIYDLLEFNKVIV